MKWDDIFIEKNIRQKYWTSMLIAVKLNGIFKNQMGIKNKCTSLRKKKVWNIYENDGGKHSKYKMLWKICYLTFILLSNVTKQSLKIRKDYPKWRKL